MEPHYALHGHSRSMSSIATTVIPITFESQLSTELPYPEEKDYQDLLAAAYIPLPPSPAQSTGQPEQGAKDGPEPGGDRARRSTSVGVAAVAESARTSLEGSSQKDVTEPAHHRASPGGSVCDLHPAEAGVGEQPMDHMDYVQDGPVEVQVYNPREEGPGLHVLGIPSEGAGGQETPKQSLEPAFPMSLDSLLETFRQSRYEAQRCLSLKARAYQEIRQCGYRKRSIPVLRHRYQQLADCLQKDRGAQFSNLYSETTCSSTGILRGTSMEQTPQDETDRATSDVPNWTSHLSCEAKEGMLGLLNNIRNLDSFLADRFASLPQAHFDRLSHLHCSAGSEHYVPNRQGTGMGHHSRPASRFSVRSEAYEKLVELRRDPLQLLVHGLFDCSGGSSAELQRRQDVWSSVCAKLINNGTSGSNHFLVAVLNEFSQTETWQLRPQLEMLILEWVQSGAFLVDPGAGSMYANESEDIRNARIAAAAPRFCDAAVEQLLDLLNKDLQMSMPSVCLNMIQATLAKIEDENRRINAKAFFFSRWYCQSFLANVLTLPEAENLLMDQHISGTMRHRLLGAIFARVNEVIVAGLHKHQEIPASPYIQTLVQQLLKVLEIPPRLKRRTLSPTRDCVDHLNFLMLEPSDVLSICMALFPNVTYSPRPRSSSFFGRAFSVASSFSGSSMTSFGTMTPMIGTASSTALSTSSTSITSDTFFNEPSQVGDRMSFSVSEANSRPLTPGGLLGSAVDTRYTGLTRELKGLVPSDLSVKGFSGLVHDAAIFYLVDGRVSLETPTPTSCGPLADMTLEPLAGDVHGASGRHGSASLYDMLQTCLSGPLQRDELQDHMQMPDGQSVYSALNTIFEMKMREAQVCFDYKSAHIWWRAMVMFSDASDEQKQAVLREVLANAENTTHVHQGLSHMYEKWLFHLTRENAVLKSSLEQLSRTRSKLRHKMWYLSDVRHSAVYAEALNTARALATMSKHSPPKERGVAAFVKKKFKTSFGSDRAQAQALATLSASRNHGGPRKLSDTQAELTLRFLTNSKIENFCQGEERIHRFCYEIQKCTQKLVAESMVASPVLWSSALYSSEKGDFGGLRSRASSFSSMNSSPSIGKGPDVNLIASQINGSRIFPFSLSPPNTTHVTSVNNISVLRSQHSQPSGHDSHFRFHTPPETSLDLHQNWALPPSPVSPGNAPQLPQLSPDQKQFLEQLRETVTSLLLSDLGLGLWSSGSETDFWMNQEKLHHGNVNLRIASSSHPDLTQLAWSQDQSGPFADPGIDLYRSDRQDSEPPAIPQSEKPCGGAARFPFEDAYRNLLARFRLSPNPNAKLNALYELVSLMDSSLPVDSKDADTRDYDWPYASGPPAQGIPRTSLTRLQVVIANCEERRISSLTMAPSHITQTPSITSLHHPSTAVSCEWLGDPKITTMIQALLLDRTFYPPTLFRDLQLIATFVPASTLDFSPQGAAFWTLGLTAMQLKASLAAGMTSRARQITSFHLDGNTSGRREPVRNDRAAEWHREVSLQRGQQQQQQQRTMGEAELKRTVLADAARLYSLAAREGDPTAARELGLFYLTHPELVRRVTLPLSKPGDVYRTVVAYPGAGATSGDKGNGGAVRGHLRGNGTGCSSSAGIADAGVGRPLAVAVADDMEVEGQETESGATSVGGGVDPTTIATAIHWMQFAADAGDRDARTFLRENNALGAT